MADARVVEELVRRRHRSCVGATRVHERVVDADAIHPRDAAGCVGGPGLRRRRGGHEVVDLFGRHAHRRPDARQQGTRVGTLVGRHRAVEVAGDVCDHHVGVTREVVAQLPERVLTGREAVGSK